jgi:hypothetical protein
MDKLVDKKILSNKTERGFFIRNVGRTPSGKRTWTIHPIFVTSENYGKCSIPKVYMKNGTAIYKNDQNILKYKFVWDEQNDKDEKAMRDFEITTSNQKCRIMNHFIEGKPRQDQKTVLKIVKISRDEYSGAKCNHRILFMTDMEGDVVKTPLSTRLVIFSDYASKTYPVENEFSIPEKCFDEKIYQS